MRHKRKCRSAVSIWEWMAPQQHTLDINIKSSTTYACCFECGCCFDTVAFIRSSARDGIVVGKEIRLTTNPTLTTWQLRILKYDSKGKPSERCEAFYWTSIVAHSVFIADHHSLLAACELNDRRLNVPPRCFLSPPPPPPCWEYWLWGCRKHPPPLYLYESINKIICGGACSSAVGWMGVNDIRTSIIVVICYLFYDSLGIPEGKGFIPCSCNNATMFY